MTARRLLALLAPVAALVAVFALAAAPAGAQTIANTASVGGQTTWLTSFATGGEDNRDPARTLRLSMLVGHPLGQTVTGLRTDDDWDGTDESGTASLDSVTEQQPSIAGGYGFSRVNYSYLIPTSNTGFSCPLIGTATRRTSDRVFRVRAHLANGSESPVSNSAIRFIATGQCNAHEDWPYIYQWGGSNYNGQITPGSSRTFDFTCDDVDTTGDDGCQGIRWRVRNVFTGAIVQGPTNFCPSGSDDNDNKQLSVTFPNRGTYVVEGELLDNTCPNNVSGGYWSSVGMVDVNSSAAPTFNLSASRPQIGGNTTVTANSFSDPDSSAGGGVEIVEWDLDDSGSFETTTLAGSAGGTLTGSQTKSHSTIGETPGLHTVRARVTDNGAMDAADSIRRTSSPITATYLVDTPPAATDQTVDTDTDATNFPITLAGTDTNEDGSHDPLTFTHGSPAHGTLSGSGANLTYTPDSGFEGQDSFTFTANDGFGGTDSGTVTINVRPGTTITSQPLLDSPSSTAAFEFETNATDPTDPVAFECRIDSGLESDFSPCTSAKTYSGLSDGQHTFQVRARAGSLIDPTPATYTWTLDGTPPDTSIDTGPSSPTGSQSASFTYHSDDTNADFECKLDSDDFEPCSSTGHSYTDLDDGVHTVQVRAVDHFGRPDPIPASFTWTVDLSVPSVHIDAAPHDPTNETTAEIAFSSTDPTATFTCSLDGSAFAACDSPETYTGLTEGDHSFSVIATNLAGNSSEPISHDWTVDTTVPDTSLDDGPPAESTSAVATFKFSSGDGTATFQCRLDSNSESDWEECSSPQLYADLADGFHNIEVRAVDAAGNKDATPATQAWQIDSTAPQTSIDSGPANATASTAAHFEFSGTDNIAAANDLTFECKLDGGDWGACASPEDLSDLEEGGHVLRVRATDPFGNTDPTPASRGWTVDTTGPAASIDSGPQDPTSSTSSTLEFSADEAATFECRLDSDQEADFAACDSPQTYASLAQGPHNLDVRATDALGNVGAVATQSWTVDTTAPDVQIDDGPSATTSSSSASFSFSSTDAGADFQCRLDGGAWQACISPRVYGGLDDGAHSFDVRARDAAGNTSAAAHADWTITNSGAPNTWITSAPAEPTVATAATFAFAASEPSTFACSLDGAAFVDCGPGTAGTSGTTLYSGLAVGGHTFAVRATDTDSPQKTDPTPATYEWTISTPPSPPPVGDDGTGDVAAADIRSPVITPVSRKLKHGRGIAATVRCGTGNCGVSGNATVKIRGRSYRASVIAQTQLASDQSTQVAVRLPKAARAALRAARKGRLTLGLTVTSPGGPVSQTFSLKVTK
jgi:Bacterial Ig domain